VKLVPAAPLPTARRASRGFGLMELLVTMVLITVVIGAIMTAFFRSAGQAQRLTDVAERRQSARTGVAMMEREIRSAGSGWGRLPVYGNDGSGNFTVISAVTPGYTSPAVDDSVVLVGAWGASTTITDPMPNSSSNFKVADVTGFNPNDLVIITNGSTAHMLQVTSTNSSSETIQHNPASVYNNPGGMNDVSRHWPVNGYGVGSLIFKITMSSYYIDRTSYRRPALIRHEYMQAPQVAAYNVDGLHVWYQLQNGTWTRNPQDLMAIEKVSPVVLTAIRDPRRPTLADSVWTAIQPRSF